ncbi:hypothetical protein [Candidatus Poriferisodalis sp.]|uniref:hypothetical protein n=1 Tax=Candidatus Poriferisodalis sp. TaxID=3101277 RepID=UPI003B02C9D1
MAAEAVAAETVRLSDTAIGRRDRLLPVADELAPLLTQPGLVRGSVLAAQGPGALTLATAFAAEVSRTGGWVTAVGLGRMGISAAAERGASLDRWAFVDKPGDAAAEVLNALIGNVDVVLLAGSVRLAAAHSRRLRARLRERGTVVIEIAASGAFSPDVTLTVERAVWTGLEQGHGRLRERRAEVVAVGRGAASLPRRAVLWLPDATGRIMTVRNAVTPIGTDQPADLADASRTDAPRTDADAVVTDVVVPLLSRAG